MSDPIKHECGLALVRLRKPLQYYRETYKTPTWGLDKLQLLMIKQRNRGQDGAGIAVVKFDPPVGEPYLLRKRSAKADATSRIFKEVYAGLRAVGKTRHRRKTDAQLKHRFDYLGEVYMGHLRYGTHGEDGQTACHPYVRKSNWRSRYLSLAGNFNLTNTSEIIRKLEGYGLHPVGVSDTLAVLEKIGHFLDSEHERIRLELAASDRDLVGTPLADEISRRIDLQRVMQQAAKDWDGGYAFVGLIGNGDAFVCRDPNGIRPAFYYENEDVVAMASERAALTTAFDVPHTEIKSVRPGHVLVIRRDNSIGEFEFREPAARMECSFERIYFSRGNDFDIYQERKALGRHLAPRALDAVEWDVDRTVFSFIPNTAEIAYLGLISGVEDCIRERNSSELLRLHEAGQLTREDITRLMRTTPRVERSAHKDQKVRTFIARDVQRHDLVSHVYDITRGSVGEDDSLVVLDDSIVRGTTLRESIITMLARLNPKRIVILSSAPPICYPDCYGIDMSELGKFVAFQAAVAIMRRRHGQSFLREIYDACLRQRERPPIEQTNQVNRLYEGITLDELSAEIARIVRPSDIEWEGELQIVYQTIDGLRDAIPNHTGDWYFTGHYPTPGGFRVVNTAYINFFDNRPGRSYED